MADEHIIYLSPEEELTNVRERLERLPDRRIILVIPAQTQLRSHVSWRLLHSRARELNKEILVISSDRQIRSVVKAAGFKVADSLESPPTSKSRRISRSGHTSLGGRTSARLHTPTGRSLPDQQTSVPGVRQPYEQSPRQYSNQTFRQQELDEKKSGRDESTMGEDKLESAPHGSATFGTSNKQFGPGYDYRIGSSPPIRPVIPAFDEDEPDQLLEDYQQSQSIRKAAQQKSEDETTLSLPKNEVSSEPGTPIYDLPSTPHDADGPFTYLEDAQSGSLPEQRASVFMDEVEDKVFDITENPTDVPDIEDLGDMGDIVGSSSAPRSWSIPPAEEEQNIAGPSRVHGVPPRTNRTGNVLPSQSDIEDENQLPPVSDQPEEEVPPLPTPVRRSGTPSGGQVRPTPHTPGTSNRPPQAVSLPQPRSQAKPAQQPLKKRPTGNRAGIGGMPRFTKQPAPSRRATAKRGSGRERLILPIVAIIMLLFFVLLIYLIPSADVSVTLPSQSFSSAMKLTATGTSRQDIVQHTLPAQTLVFDTSAVQLGHASGSTTVGTIQAKGNVVFTNNGASQVVIPTATPVATKSGIQFTTTAEALALPNSTILVPIQAQNPGVNSNVPPNTITVITSDGLLKIQQANPGVTLNLSIVNTDPTTGGGAGTATSVTMHDVNTVKSTLDRQLQVEAKDFLKKNVQAGDEQGKPLQVETILANPPVNHVATDGTFTETLKLHMTVLVVRAADLRAAATAGLKDALNKQNRGLALVPQQAVELKQVKNVPAQDGKSLTLSFTAQGQVAPVVSEDAVRSLVSGKTIDDAKHALTGNGGIPGIMNTQITVYPGFFHWLPFWQQRITVHFKTVPQVIPKPAPKPKRK